MLSPKQPGVQEFLQSCFMWLSLNNTSSSFQKGQEGREKFGFQVQRLNPNSSTTNREKRKTKNYMMLKHKARGKLKRSFKEKQVQGNYVIITWSTGALLSSYTNRICTTDVKIVSTVIYIKNLGLSHLAGSRETDIWQLRHAQKNGIPIGNKYTVSRTVTIDLMIVVAVKSKRSRLYGVSYTYIITDCCVHLNIS